MSEPVGLTPPLHRPPLPMPGALLPHTPPWLLVDRLVSLSADEVRADKLVTANDPLCGRGLGDTLLVEALAQTAACLNAATGAGARHFGLLVQARGFVFDGRAAVGDTVSLMCRKTAQLGALHRFLAEASVDGKVIAAGEMTFALGPA